MSEAWRTGRISLLRPARGTSLLPGKARFRYRARSPTTPDEMPPASPIPDEVLARAQLQADPLADRTIAEILGPWQATVPGAADWHAAHAAQWERIALVNRLIAQWRDNASIADWQAPAGVPAEVGRALQAYLRQAHALPDWADAQRIARAEALFFDQGALSITLLFCASLPECYVVPDLADVLHTTGRLEQRTDHRIRSTAAMIFPVMMRGGLTDAAGSGVAQVLKVRLIHATVRHLILRGSPDAALAGGGPAVVAPLTPAGAPSGMHQALFAHGWDVGARGLPSNQEEQAYTLLTFGYVILRGMRALGAGLAPADEEAVLHAWNVVGHLVGIRRELMVETMTQAEALFGRMQARGRASLQPPDVRPALAAALFDTMAQAIPWRVLRPFPLLLSRRLCGAAAAADLGMDDRVSLASRALFALLMGLLRGIDALGRLFAPGFSLSRLVTRVLGYHLLTRMLMDQTRPLKLPDMLLRSTHAMIAEWGEDRRAPRWLNALEDHFTVAGAWRARTQP